MNVNIQIARILPTKKYFRANYFLFKPASSVTALLFTYTPLMADCRQYIRRRTSGLCVKLQRAGVFQC
jgi:hypothetical protein